MKPALANFQTLPLKDAARQLLARLGYKSDKFLVGAGSKPQDFLADFATGHPFDEAKALVSDWKSADLLFQLTDQELSRESSLFTDDSVQRGLLKSYIFIAIELKGTDYARGKFSAIARQINRLFPMPVMVLFKHADRLTIAVINRRRHKLDDNKDVLEKATLIRDISLANPHRGHLDILASLALSELKHPQKLPITDFDTLHAAWEQIFNVELLNERFYRELANWYFWALPQVEFPADLDPDDEKRRATGLIRLLTRLIFCWFLKEKSLIPEKLFHPTDLAKLLKGFDPESETSSTYYQAILQNLFFATLNQRMGKDGNGKPYRFFAADEGFQKNRATYDINNLYRYEKLFAASQDDALAVFADIPFLNGGLFECLDRTEEGTDKKRYLDGFSRNAQKRPLVPDRLFFDSGETADLSEVYGDKKRKSERVTGLISILNRYKFTIVENTPIDQEIALDPELLGKVFENLLASYNEETKTTARKQTGSFYTPRPIVDYMVDESLKAHLTRSLVEKVGMKEPDAKAGLDLLFAYTEKEHPFSAKEVATLITAIDDVKILDPACGSGAFPMGVLHKLVYILGKLDPDNGRWKQTQLAKLDSAPMREALEDAFAENNDDYGRKLYLIENCLYGVDIQPIAIQITKLRFFISLVCDQKTNRNKKDNHGIRPLPNLETKFVAADTLIGIPKKIVKEGHFDLTTDAIQHLQKQLQNVRHQYFTVQFRRDKLRLQKEDKDLRQKLAHELARSYAEKSDADTVEKLAFWDPFDPQCTSGFFDAEWMFGNRLAEKFDIVIGNPPYGFHRIHSEKAKAYFKQNYVASQGSFEHYFLFYEAALRLLGRNGVLAFIAPVTWLTIPSANSLRRFILEGYAIKEICWLSEQAFESASVNTLISIITNSSEPITRIKFFELLSEFPSEPKKQTEIPQKRFVDAGHYISIFSGDEDNLIVEKIRRVSKPLTEFARPCSGYNPYEVGSGEAPEGGPHTKETVQEKPYHSNSKLSSQWKREIVGRDLHRYHVKLSGERWIKYGPWLSAPRSPENFQGKRILVQEITGGKDMRLVAAYHEGELYHSRDVIPIKLDKSEMEPLYLLAAINSWLLTWYHQKCNPKAQKGLFPKVLVSDLKSLPIFPANGSQQSAITSLSKEVLEAKLANPAADTSALEREIDQQVYALYGLTPEEIAVVEGTAL